MLNVIGRGARNIMKVLIGTKNPSKIEGAKKAFDKFFDNVEIIGVDASSNVSDQPFNEDVLQGAKNRVEGVKNYAVENNIEADFYIAIEAGIVDYFNEYINFNISVIEDKDGLQSVGVSQGFPIPERLIPEIKSNGLGRTMDRLFSGHDLGKSVGGISFLTKETVTRMDIVENSFTMALIKFINGDLWK